MTMFTNTAYFDPTGHWHEAVFLSWDAIEEVLHRAYDDDQGDADNALLVAYVVDNDGPAWVTADDALVALDADEGWFVYKAERLTEEEAEAITSREET